jgi:hypothetical protein
MRASIKPAVVSLTGMAVAAIADPGLTQALANLVGVRYGTDLLLYVLVVVFAFAQASWYFRFKEVDLRLASAVRSQAIESALVREGMPGGVNGPHEVAPVHGGHQTTDPPPQSAMVETLSQIGDSGVASDQDATVVPGISCRPLRSMPHKGE